MSIADDVQSGFQCSWCGVCFNDEHGYPVVCSDCYKYFTKYYCKGDKKEANYQIKKLGLKVASIKEL